MIRDYIVGTYRQKCYSSKYFNFLIRLHIKQQYRLRRAKARVCEERGSCLFCGCKTPDLFFANKACGLSEVEDFTTRRLIANKSIPCYDKMLSKKEWKKKILKLSSWDKQSL